MSKKFTIEYIKHEFEKEGYILLSDKYLNNKIKLDYICPEGHKHSINWNSWQRGNRCPVCAINKSKMSLGFIKKQFIKEGYILTSSNYNNSKVKLNYICPEGHKHKTTWNSWKSGRRCPTCKSTKLTLKQVKESFENVGYVLLSKVYKNNTTKLDYICSKGHKHSMTWHNWQIGARCPTCRCIELSIMFSGSGGPSWKGGISKEPYCQDWTKEYREFIKERDGYKCLNPYCDSKNPDDLTVHHIDYNKKNCGLENLITVCRSCNTRANTDRKWHKAWYKALINKRYNKNSA